MDKHKFTAGHGSRNRKTYQEPMMIRNGRRRQNQPPVTYEYTFVPRPPLSEMNSQILSILDTTDVLRLEAKLGGNATRMALVKYTNYGSSLTSPSLQRRRSASASRPASLHSRSEHRGFTSLFDAMSPDSPPIGQIGRTNFARRAHAKSGRACVSPSMLLEGLLSTDAVTSAVSGSPYRLCSDHILSCLARRPCPRALLAW